MARQKTIRCDWATETALEKRSYTATAAGASAVKHSRRAAQRVKKELKRKQRQKI
jgi:hypothetical protein